MRVHTLAAIGFSLMLVGVGFIPPAQAASASACGLVLLGGSIQANCIVINTSHTGGSPCTHDPSAGAYWCSASTFTATVTIYGWINAGAVEAEMEEIFASPQYAPGYEFCTEDADAAAWAGIPFDGGNAVLTLTINCDAGYCFGTGFDPYCVDVRLNVRTFGANNPGSFVLHETYY